MDDSSQSQTEPTKSQTEQTTSQDATQQLQVIREAHDGGNSPGRLLAIVVGPQVAEEIADALSLNYEEGVLTGPAPEGFTITATASGWVLNDPGEPNEIEGYEPGLYDRLGRSGEEPSA